MNRTRIAALAVTALALAGCGGNVPRSTPATTAPAPAPSAAAASRAPGAAFCAKLEANPKTVQVVYASEVERQVSLASGGGSVTPESIAAARAIVALWITISCPKFAYLEQHG